MSNLNFNLIDDWNKNRSKAKRLDIINKLNCPAQLLLRAFKLYDAKEILELPVITIRMDFMNDIFLRKAYQACYDENASVYSLEPQTFTIPEHTTLMYLLALHTNKYNEAITAFCDIRYKEYLVRVIKKRPELFMDNTSLMAVLHAHLKQAKILTPAELSLRISKLSPAISWVNGWIKFQIDDLISETIKDKKMTVDRQIEYLCAALEYFQLLSNTLGLRKELEEAKLTIMRKMKYYKINTERYDKIVKGCGLLE